LQLAPVLIDAQIEKDCRYWRPRRAALRDEGTDPFRVLRRTDWLTKWDSDPEFFVLPPTTGRTPITVHERDIAAAIDPLITLPPRRGRHAGPFGQSNLTFCAAQERSRQNPADFARKRQ
jgi:hypothetical protein